MSRVIKTAMLHCLLVVATGFGQPQGAETATTPPDPAAPAAIPAPLISVRALETATFLRRVSTEVEVKEELTTIKEDFSSREDQMDDLRKETQRRVKLEGPASIIEETVKEWTRMQQTLQGWIDGLSSKVDSFDSVLEKLDIEREVWTLTRDSAAGSGYPSALRRQIRETLDSINSSRQKVLSSRAAVLTLQVSIGSAKARTDETVAAQRKEIAKRQQNLLGIDSPPLWEVFDQSDSQDGFGAQFSAAWEINVRWIRRYVSEQTDKLVRYGLLFVVLGFGLILLRRKVRVLGQRNGEVLSANLLERPIAAAVVITLLLYEFMNPAAPKAWSALLGLFLLLGILRMMPQLTLKTKPSWPYLLALLFFLQQTVKLTPEGFTVNRLALFLLSLAGMAIAIWMVRHYEGISKPWQPAAKNGAQVAAVLFGVGVVANLVGSVSLAMAVTTGTLYSIFAAISFVLANVLFRAIVTGSMLLPSAQRSGIFSRRPEATRHTLFRIMATLAIVGWAIFTLRGFLLLEPFLDLVKAVLAAGVSIGAFSLTLDSVLTLLFVVWISFKLSQLIRFLLDTDILPRMKLDRGVPATITRLTHYAVVVLGVLVGFTAAGFPFDRTTIIFGGLGVGIGFGLQNVVNNFVSGLILLFERPIKIGDRIQLGTDVGVVQEMGIRASTVRTVQGASVIVPNANLISAEVVNWTHRDELRRADIPVGVAYGTDPQEVIDLLLRLAADHPEVSGKPAPEALFLDFGDSALCFELRVWAGAENWVPVSSNLRLAISHSLIEAGIEIPFPQRDLHLRSINDSVSLPIARTAEDETQTDS